MILHNFNRSHIIVAYAVGGDTVPAAEQIGSFDIKLVDVFPLIPDYAIIRDVNAGHTLEDVAD